MTYRLSHLAVAPFLLLACFDPGPTDPSGARAGGEQPAVVAQPGPANSSLPIESTESGAEGIADPAEEGSTNGPSEPPSTSSEGPAAEVEVVNPTEEASAAELAERAESTELQWLPSWATTIQTTEPRNGPPPLENATLRQFVWPTVSGEQVRIQLSNEKGSEPVDISQVHLAKALTQQDPANSEGRVDAATDVAFTFDEGSPSVTIAPGQTKWSDPIAFSLEALDLTAISMQFGSSVPPEITGHPGARTTSYVEAGDWVGTEALPNPETRDRWYFINAIEVMAPQDAYAIAVLGDSITDGYGVLNRFARWPDFLTAEILANPELAGKRSVLNFGMGANNLTVTGQYQDSGLLRFERDVLSRDKIKWLVVLEGINDIVYSNVPAQPLKDAYAEIIERAQAAGIRVYGSPILPTNQGSAAIRNDVNDYIRTQAGFDAVIELDRAVDPTGAGVIAPQFDNDGLHPSDAGYEAMGKAVDLGLFADSTLASTATPPAQ